MPLFLTREEAEAFCATITKHPDLVYTVGPEHDGGWGVEVSDADGVLITEAYDGEADLGAIIVERQQRTDDARRRGGKVR